MRLAAKEKRGYVPLPPRTLELVEQRIAPASFDGLIRGLDPCAGKGWALYDLTRRLRSIRSENNSAAHVLPYAVEPNYERWDQCLDRFGRDYAVNAPWEEMTVANHASRFIVLCEALESTREEPVIAAFERLFLERGLPNAIRSDNGLPFASPNGLFHLSKLSVWWLRLGIAIERIRPGRPQQNGRLERMHLTLKQETARPPGLNIIQQQERFDAFRVEFNCERPHQALAMRPPAEIYTPPARPYNGLPDLDYPFHDRDILVTACGRICMHRKKISISTVLAGQWLGIKEVDDGIWLVSFMHYDLGYIDLEQRTLQPLDNPFGTRLLPMS
jgi:transposase InsO family protein